MHAGNPSLLVPIAMFGWPIVALALFAWLPGRSAALWSYLIAWLFLPNYQYQVVGLPDYSKVSAASFAVIAGMTLFHGRDLAALRPSWIDAPILCLLASPFFASLMNDLGAYDGMSASLGHCILWGAPYLVGRVYLRDLAGFHAMALTIVFGALLYVPLCVVEMVMSPQLHRWVYGFHAHHFAQSIRMGGYRPTVFMPHGLVLGMWMSSATLLGLLLWKARAWRTLFGYPAAYFLWALVPVTVMCRSLGALALLTIGLGTLWGTRAIRSPALIFALAAVPVLYIATRSTDMWSGQWVVEQIRANVSAERADSLAFRLENEGRLLERALERPVFGWGGWGRSRVLDEHGQDITVTDGYWIIIFGSAGLVGLAGLFGTMLLPPVALASKIPGALWLDPRLAPAAGLITLACLFAIDSLLNASVSPFMVMALGGMASMVAVGIHAGTWAKGELGAHDAMALRARNRARAATARARTRSVG